MQFTSVAPRHICYYPLNPIKFPSHHHVRPSKKITTTATAFQPLNNHTHLAINLLYTLTAINSCNKDQDKKNNDTSFYSSIDINNAGKQPTKKPEEEEGKKPRKESKGILPTMWWADFKAALGQRINLEGLVCAVSVISRDRHLALPHVSVRDIRYIDWPALKRAGFQGVVFDKDNTITVPYSLALWGPLGSSLESCKSVFGSNNIAVFSNSAGLLEYDPDGRKARALEFVIGIKVIRHRVKKPAGSAEEIERHFGCESSRLIMVGDRPFTDIVYGNQNGFLTILTQPLSLKEEPFIVKQVRKLEIALVNRWSKRGFKPSNHRLLEDSLHCVKDLPFL